jgi:hypothetical protein
LLAGTPAANRDATLANAHRERRNQAMTAWIADLERVGVAVPMTPQSGLRAALAAGNATASATPAGTTPNGGFPAAARAARLAVGKGAVEIPLIAEITRRSMLAASTSPSELEKVTADEVWSKIAALHGEEAKLDESSRRLIREHNPAALQAARVTETKRKLEDPLLRLVANLQNSIALDTVRNQYLYHTRIHDWFAASEAVTRDVEELNKRTYAELFLTPDADPWLGLLDEGVYTGIRNDGVRR